MEQKDLMVGLVIKENKDIKEDKESLETLVLQESQEMKA